MTYIEGEPTQDEQNQSLQPRRTETGVAQDAEGFLRALSAAEIEEDALSPWKAVFTRIQQNNNPPSAPAGGRKRHTSEHKEVRIFKADTE